MAVINKEHKQIKASIDALVCSVIELMMDDYTHTLRISDAVSE
jgi:hypothetical protein